MNIKDSYIHGADGKGVVKFLYFASAAENNILGVDGNAYNAKAKDLIFQLADIGGTKIGLSIPTWNQNTTGSAGSVLTIKRSTDADHFLTFVDTNNDQATAESVYTAADIKYNPSTKILTVPNLSTNSGITIGGTFVTIGSTYSPVTSITADSTDDDIPSAAAVWAMLSSGLQANDAMVFKGVLNGGTNTAYTPAAECGHVYKVAVAGKINGDYYEVGDTLICAVDNTAAATSSNVSTVKANWYAIQTNIADYLLKTGGTMTGNLKWKDTTALPTITSMANANILVVDGMDTNTDGTTKQISITTLKAALEVSDSSHTHSVKINGNTKTIAATGETAVDLGKYVVWSDSVRDTAKIYNIGSGRIFTGLEYTDGPVAHGNWVSGIALGYDWNDNHHQHYLVENGNRWYTTRTSTNQAMDKWYTFAYLSDLPSTKNITINGNTYAIYTSAESLPSFIAPVSLSDTGGYVLATSSDKSTLEWIAMSSSNVPTSAIIGSDSNSTTQISSTQVNPYYNLLEGGNVERSIQFVGGGTISVSSSTSSVITFSNTVNDKDNPGYVAAPKSENNYLANKVWKTDANGNPAWRDDLDNKILHGSITITTTYSSLFSYESPGGAARSFILNVECHHSNTVLDKTFYICTSLNNKVTIRELYCRDYGTTITLRVSSAGNYWNNTRVDIKRTSGIDGTLRFTVIPLDNGTATIVSGSNVEPLSTDFVKEYATQNVEDAVVRKAIDADYVKWSGITDFPNAIGSATQPIYWSGSAFVQADSYPTKSSWNYDDRYVTFVGVTDDTTNHANQLRYVLNGTSNYFTVPYASNADKLNNLNSTDFIRISVIDKAVAKDANTYIQANTLYHSNGDLNSVSNYQNIGWDNFPVNRPGGGWWLLNLNQNSAYKHQIAGFYNDTHLWVRRQNHNGTNNSDNWWNSWQKIMYSSDISVSGGGSNVGDSISITLNSTTTTLTIPTITSQAEEIYNNSTSLTVSSWTSIKDISAYDEGTYAISISASNLYASGIFSICGGTDVMIDEIVLHVSNKTNGATWRPYARVSGKNLELSCNEAAGTSRTYIVKILKLI